MEIRELTADETPLAAAALLELRPQFGDAGPLLAQIERQRADGYRVLAAFGAGGADAAAVAGFRITEHLAWGRTLYVDDLVTRAAHRRAGHAAALLERLVALGRAEGCDALHLDSGVGPHRVDAHRRYHAAGLGITSLHFSLDLRPPRAP